MRMLLGAALLLLSSVAAAQYGGGRGGRGGGRDFGRGPHQPYIVAVSVRGQSYYPDNLTAEAVCRLNGKGPLAGLTQIKQAGDRIDGQRSIDGRPQFSPVAWRGGMALDVVTCYDNHMRRDPIVIAAGGLFHPDQMTAQAICVSRGFYRENGFSQSKVAGNRIDGQRSYDGRPYFMPATWYGGMAISTVSCF